MAGGPRRGPEPGELDGAVQELGEIVRKTGLERTVAVGTFVLDRFFCGQPELWRARRRNKNNSVRRLARRPECPLSRSALNQAIGVAIAVRSSPAIQALPHIDASHIGSVLAIPSAEQERWLRTADANRWSVRRLRAELTAAHRAAGERRGRPTASTARKAASALASAVRRMQTAIARLVPGDLAVLTRAELEDLLRQSQQAEARLHDLRLALPPR